MMMLMVMMMMKMTRAGAMKGCSALSGRDACFVIGRCLWMLMRFRMLIQWRAVVFGLGTRPVPVKCIFLR